MMTEKTTASTTQTPEQAGASQSSVKTSNSREHLAVGIVPCGEWAFRAVTVLVSDGAAKQIKESRVLVADSDSASGKATAMRLGADTPVVLAIPRWEAIIRTVRVPTSDPTQIARMIPFEAASHLPWPPEESEVAYELQETDTDGFATVQLFMARKDVIEGYLRQLKDFGISPTRVELSVVALTRLLASSDDPERPALFVVGKCGVEYLRLAGGHHSFSRGAAAEAAPSEMLRRSQDLDKRRHGPRQSHTSLTLAGTDDNIIEQSLDSEHGAPPIRRISDVDFASLNGAGPIASEDAVCVAATLGARDASPSSNLLPERQARRLTARKLFRQLRVLALLTSWSVFAASGVGYACFSQQELRADRAEQGITALQGEEGDLREQSRAVLLLKGERGKVALPLRVVLELYERTPQQIAINSMRYDGRGNLEVSGEALSFPEVYRYMNDLLGSELFQNVEMKHSSRPQSTGTKLVEFKVTCTVGAGG